MSRGRGSAVGKQSGSSALSRPRQEKAIVNVREILDARDLPRCNDGRMSDQGVPREADGADIRQVSPAGLAPGPGYSHVVTVGFTGRLAIISGQVALDADGNLVGPGDLEAQTRQVFANLATALTSANAGWEHVIKFSYFVRDAGQVMVVRTVRDEFLPSGVSPASTLVEVSRLFRDDLLIEVEALAVIPA